MILKPCQELDLNLAINSLVSAVKFFVCFSILKELYFWIELDELQKCTKLTHFNFSFNKIAAIPDSYGDQVVILSD